MYNRLQEIGLTVSIKRHVFTQAVSVPAAREALLKNIRFARFLSPDAIQSAFERLPDERMASEFTVIEGWTQKQNNNDPI